MKCEEAQELITALVDQELSDAERSSVESHLKDCIRCQFVLKQEQALKTAVRMAAASVTAPADLREKILSGMSRIPEKGGVSEEPESRGWLFQLMSRPAFVFALLLLLFLPTFYLMRLKEPSIPLFALESHQKLIEGTLSYIREENPQELKRYLLRSVDGRFVPMGYDLSMIGLRPVGGTVQEVAGRKILVTVYEGADFSLTCYTLIGTEKDVAEEATLFVDPDKQINFYSFSRGGVNGVLYRQGDILCILVSKLPVGKLLALARSQARPNPPL